MAVYTRLTKAEINQHLKDNYRIGELVDFKEIVAGIDNSNFIIQTDQKYILTIFENRIKPAELPFFINLKAHLAKKGVCCPKPILNNNNSSISDLKDKKSSIVTFLNGAMLEPRSDGLYDSITPKHCFEVGKITAQMHEAAKDFEGHRTNDLGVFGFESFLAKFEHLIENYQLGLLAKIKEQINFLKTNWQENLPSCAAHLDLFPDNVFFDENQNISGVIDFYFAANDLMIYDFAVIVNAWCFDESITFDEEKCDEMLRGYEEVRKFSIPEKDFLKTSLKAASLRFLLSRLHDIFFTPKDSLVNVKDPHEYVKKLEFFSN
ncbi:MAG: homoserine kinase [Rickettsiales bacterium]|nr:homoserine kinase [Rickettsiales bacterium]